jgi:fructokinase
MSFSRNSPLPTALGMLSAGDAFAAVFLLGRIQGWPVEKTLEPAHCVAGKISCVRGTIPDSGDFYRPFITAWHSAEGQAA